MPEIHITLIQPNLQCDSSETLNLCNCVMLYFSESTLLVW